LEAVRHGKTLALANKEALVVAGPIMTNLAKSSGAKLMPIDSEHSAIFQALQSGRSIDEVKRVVLTASGGSLRAWPSDKLSSATVEDALAHPTWKMGRKITVDSATMMNKALEVIEAKWLFGLDPSKISVVIHPQSIIHSMVEFVDGSVIAQLSPPDMRLPIQYALTFPHRYPGPAKAIDWTQNFSFDWTPVDFQRYPALLLGFEVAAAGGTSGSVLNGANEAAVDLFLNQKIAFTDIAILAKKVLDYHDFDPSPTLTQLMELDQWARKETNRIAGC
jgi:1-deoxy-D-xylulose-5-phosphate reductoisomerase